MRTNFTKKRLVVSCILLIAGVLLLRPYLTSNPHRDIPKSVASLDKPLAASVTKALFLGQAIVEKGRELSVDDKNVASFIEKLSGNVQRLKAELDAMPSGAKELTEGAKAAYAELEKELKELILSSSEEDK